MWQLNVEEVASQEETILADAVEPVSTIAGSLGSIGSISQVIMSYFTQFSCHFNILPFQCVGEVPIYDTDLNSEFDEAELKRDLLKDVSIKIERI